MNYKFNEEILNDFSDLKWDLKKIYSNDYKKFYLNDNERIVYRLFTSASPDKDVVIGLAASGTTPYVISALNSCNQHGITTASISCNPGAPLSAAAKFPIEVVVGPEFVTGSTRMKSGTAQKLVLNMISTAVMIGLGRVEDNKMVNMQLTNEKLVDRGVHMLMKQINTSDYEVAKALLLQHGSVKKATDAFMGS
jgi:N-acetylmuramic acid 6-phosphate etherase